MQYVEVICLGRLHADYLARGCEEYEKRLRTLADFHVTELPEVPLREKNLSQSEIDAALEKEGRAILARVRRGSRLVALCIEGNTFSSEELAEAFSSYALSGSGDVTFVIGSSHGLSGEVKRRAELRLSMSRMTFPHQLARMMLLEQIYRAFSINAGMKYHK